MCIFYSTHFRGYGRNQKKTRLYSEKMRARKFASEIFRPLVTRSFLTQDSQTLGPSLKGCVINLYFFVPPTVQLEHFCKIKSKVVMLDLTKVLLKCSKHFT